MKISVINAAGAAQGEIEIADELLIKNGKGTQAVHDTIVAYNANQRLGTASTKQISEVHGSGKKPWRQKGTGRARAGSFASPLWRGGGVVFGPKPRDFGKKVSRKTRQLALRKDRKSTRLNSSHGYISYAVFCLKKKKQSKNEILHINL